MNTSERRSFSSFLLRAYFIRFYINHVSRVTWSSGIHNVLMFDVLVLALWAHPYVVRILEIKQAQNTTTQKFIRIKRIYCLPVGFARDVLAC